jgi:hypothetical protein
MKIMKTAKPGQPLKIVGYSSNQYDKFMFFLSDGTVLLATTDFVEQYRIRILNVEEVDKVGIALIGATQFDIQPTQIMGAQDGMEAAVEVQWETTSLKDVIEDQAWSYVDSPVQFRIDVNETFGEDLVEGFEDSYGSEHGIIDDYWKDKPWGATFYALKGYFTPEFIAFVRSGRDSFFHIV